LLSAPEKIRKIRNVNLGSGGERFLAQSLNLFWLNFRASY
jgi:hypothetical protein